MIPQRLGSSPTPELARSFGLLLVSAAQLRHVMDAVVEDADDVFASHCVEWREYAAHLIDTHDRIVAAVSNMRFTGSFGEHPVIRGEDGVAVPADVGFVNVLCRRMEKHARVGRLLVVQADPVREALPV